MKQLGWLFCLLFSSLLIHAQNKKKNEKLEGQIVEISCGECQFKLPGKSCDLAIRMDGKAYFVDGKNINDFGDAHAKDGFCNAVRKAKVTGEFRKQRFKASKITLLQP